MTSRESRTGHVIGSDDVAVALATFDAAAVAGLADQVGEQQADYDDDPAGGSLIRRRRHGNAV